MTGKRHIGGVESKKMSDLMAVINVDGEKLICVDFDRPVWHSKIDPNLKATPNLDHFVVDGILGVASNTLLKKYGINERFNSNHFEMDKSSLELQMARQKLYQASGINVDYFHDFNGDIQIHKDLAKFRMPLGKIIQLSTQDLINFSN